MFRRGRIPPSRRASEARTSSRSTGTCRAGPPAAPASLWMEVAAARVHSRAPGGRGVERCPTARVPGAELFPQVAQAKRGLFEMRAEAARFPDLELQPLSHERHLVGDVRVVPDRGREDHAALAIHLQRLAAPVEGGREQVPLRRVGRLALDQLRDLPQQRVATAVQGVGIEGGRNEEPLEAVARQHRPERTPGSTRDPWHPHDWRCAQRTDPRDTPPADRSADTASGPRNAAPVIVKGARSGMAWDSMGFYGTQPLEEAWRGLRTLSRRRRP